jgi:hypothetical protein
MEGNARQVKRHRSVIVCVLSLAISLITQLAPAQSVDIKVKPVFDGLPILTNSAGMYVQLENRGGDIEGEVGQDSNFEEGVAYPVSLPSGAKKRIYYRASSYFSGTVMFRTRLRDFKVSVNPEYLASSSSRYVLIGNNPNDLIFLKKEPQQADSNGERASVILTGGALPEDAPDRNSAYAEIDAVVLAEGSERLEKRQADAIYRYVTAGGTLVFVGGAGTSALKDPKWSDLIPIFNPSTQTKNGATITSGLLKPGAKESDLPVGKAITRIFGFGRVVLLTADPFEEPFKSAKERRTSIYRAMVRSSIETLKQGINAEFGISNGYTNMSFTPMGGMRPNLPQTDAFDITAPSSTSVFQVLVFYIIFVIPVNFLILRKLKKLEWAWITVPIISVVFSLIFLRTTVSLYSAAATTKTNAIAFIDGSGSQESTLVFGKSEMFFPTAGQYDLKLKDVDNVGSQAATRTKLEFIDTGSEVIAPGIQASNLNFREFTFTQRRSDLQGIQCTYNPKTYQFRIKNDSKISFEQCFVQSESGSQNGSSNGLKPGEEATFTFGPNLSKVPPNGNIQSDSLQSSLFISIRNSEIPIFVRLTSKDLRIGPLHGTAHPQSQLTVIIRPTLEVK